MRAGKRKFTFETLEPREMLAADPIITEFMASNGNTLKDGHGATPDWIEIFNNGDQSVNLAGYRLTDDATDTNKWLFPSYVLESGDYLIVFASGNNTPDSAGSFRTNFSLSADGEYLALVDPGGSVLSEFGSNGTVYPAQTSDISYGWAFNSTLTNVVTPDSVESNEESSLAAVSDEVTVTLSDERSTVSFLFFSLHSISPVDSHVPKLEPVSSEPIDYVFEQLQSPTSNLVLSDREIVKNGLELKATNYPQGSIVFLDAAFDEDLTIRLGI